MTTTPRHVISLLEQPTVFAALAGSISRVDQQSLPVLKGLSIRHLWLGPRAIREPHWHANAHELGYCVSGTALVTIIGNHGRRESFLIGAGEMFFSPSGALHAIENCTGEPAEFILAFSHERPEDFALSQAFGAMSEGVLANTFGERVKRPAELDFRPYADRIFSLDERSPEEKQASHPNPFKYAIEDAPAHIVPHAGSARMAHSANWPVLEGISMFSVRITDSGMREPHWHPGTAEMGYVLRGSGRMTVLDPDGATDTYPIEPGDTYFIPPAYPHHIENTGSDVLHLLIFFNRDRPEDIGYRAAAAGYSRTVAAAELRLALADLPSLPVDTDDPLIVAKIWNF